MQKRALKQLNKVTQWTNEKVFSGEKTQLSDDFTAFEKEVEVRRIGIERLHATSLPFFNQLTKVKPTADPHTPSGSSKDKILITEALGLVMISYGDDVGGSYGDALAKYGRARCKLAMAQEDFSTRLSEGYIAGMEASLAAVNDYKVFRKKLDSRRLTLDAAINKVQTTKKDPRAAEEELRIAQARFEETEEETQGRLMAIQEGEDQQFADLADLLDAEMEYFTKCHAILEDLRNEWPSGASSGTRPRAKSNASGRSAGRAQTQPRSYTRPGAAASSEEENQIANRSRSDSNASGSKTPKEKRSMIPSFGSLGKKTGNGIPKTFRREKYGTLDDNEEPVGSLRSDDDDDDEERFDRPSMSSSLGGSGGGGMGMGGRARSQSAVTTYSRTSTASIPDSINTATSPSLAPSMRAPPMRRTHTTPTNPHARYVKALYDFAGTAADELGLKVGQIVEIKSEVSSDWYIGEADGRSGLFPSSYVEEYVPTPTTATQSSFQALQQQPPQQRNMPPPAGAPIRRNLPPPVSGGLSQTPSSRPPASITVPPPSQSSNAYSSYDAECDTGIGYESKDDLSELDNEDEDYKQSVGLATTARPPAITRPSFGVGAGAKKAPPPPPPSRRSASSTNLMTATSSHGTSGAGGGAALAAPIPMNRTRSSTLDRKSTLSPHGSQAGLSPQIGGAAGKTLRLDSSPEGSPFVASEDEEVMSVGSGDGSGPGGGTSSGPRGLTHGLGNLHLASGSGGASDMTTTSISCGTCGCDDFTQNVFKPKGTCSTCFHLHG